MIHLNRVSKNVWKSTKMLHRRSQLPLWFIDLSQLCYCRYRWFFREMKPKKWLISTHIWSETPRRATFAAGNNMLKRKNIMRVCYYKNIRNTSLFVFTKNLIFSKKWYFKKHRHTIKSSGNLTKVILKSANALFRQN